MKQSCKNCDDKGYNTIMQGLGSIHGTVEPVKPRVKICEYCERGKQLQKYFIVRKGMEAIL